MADRIDWEMARAPFMVYAAWAWLRRQYDDFPGPWWIKLPLVAVLLMTPGPDEVLVLALPAIGRKIKSMRNHGA